MRYFILLISLMFMFSMPAMLSCGSSDGDDDDDDSADPESCAPSTLAAPTVDLNTDGVLGPWQLDLDQTSSTCDHPPESIACILEMDVNGNDVDISGTCESEADVDVTVTVTGISGIVSGDTLYWGGTLRGASGTYTETDTIPCNGVEFISDRESEEFDVTVSVSWEDGDESDTCSTSFTGQFGGY